MLDYKISRIIAGFVRYKRPTSSLLIRKPSEFYKIQAHEMWTDIYENSLCEGTGMTSDEYEDYIRIKNIWTDEKELKLKTLPKDLEELKLKYYECDINLTERDSIRKLLKVVKADIEYLYQQKNSYFYLTAKGIADLFKSKFLLGMSLYKENGKRLFDTSKDYLDNEISYMDDIYAHYCLTRFSEADIREIARSEEWKSYWSCSKGNNPFGKPAVKLTDEQRHLISWSKLYDNIHKHQDCPAKYVIEDDDMLDGWMILQKRKSDEDKEQKKFEERFKGKFENVDELFVPVETQEQANKLYKMNKEAADNLMKKKMRTLERLGTMSEGEMPDTMEKKAIEFTKKRLQLENRG